MAGTHDVGRLRRVAQALHSHLYGLLYGQLALGAAAAAHDVPLTSRSDLGGGAGGGGGGTSARGRRQSESHPAGAVGGGGRRRGLVRPTHRHVEGPEVPPAHEGFVSKGFHLPPIAS